MPSDTDFEGPKHRRAARPIIRSQSGVISAGHYLAASAGQEMLQNGGNAVDAGVAAGLAINVVHHDMTSFGGVAPIILYSAEADEVFTISGLGRWPKNASREYFNENSDGQIPRGIERAVVPAAPDAWITAVYEHGNLTFGEVASPAIRLACDGYPIFEFQEYNISRVAESSDLHKSTKDIVLPDGTVPEVGDVLVQEALAETLEAMVQAEQQYDDRLQGLKAARDYFYEGPIAESIDNFSRSNDGLLRKSDLAQFSVGTEDPVRVRYKNYEVYTCGPWCQGPVLAQALKILEQFDLEDMGHNSPEYSHTVLEALKLSFADREWYYGDPDFVDVPMDVLVSESYAEQRAEHISSDSAWSELPPPGKIRGSRPQQLDISHHEADPIGPSGPLRPDTSYVAAMDSEGNLFSATPSDSWHQMPIVPDLGFAISARGSQSQLDARHPASVEPWKRPRLTPNPALVLKDGKPYMALGTPGGDVQPQAMLQVFLNQVLFDMNPQQAVEVPRVSTYNFPASFSPHAYYPGVSATEAQFPNEVQTQLGEKGHRMYKWPKFGYRAGAVSVVRRKEGSQVLEASADPRRENYAVGK